MFRTFYHLPSSYLCVRHHHLPSSYLCVSKPMVVPHVITALTPTTYPCTHDGCSRVYNQRKGLNRHLKSHQEKSFVCEISGCGKSYFRGEHLKEHVKNKHGGSGLISKTIPNNVISCDLPGCNSSFPSRDNLLLHMNECHNIKSPSYTKEFESYGDFKVKLAKFEDDNSSLYVKRDSQRTPLYHSSSFICGWSPDSSASDLLSKSCASPSVGKKIKKFLTSLPQPKGSSKCLSTIFVKTLWYGPCTAKI